LPTLHHRGKNLDFVALEAQQSVLARQNIFPFKNRQRLFQHRTTVWGHHVDGATRRLEAFGRQTIGHQNLVPLGQDVKILDIRIWADVSA